MKKFNAKIKQKEKVLVKNVNESVKELRRIAKAYYKALEKAERLESKLNDFADSLGASGGDNAGLYSILEKVGKEINRIENPSWGDKASF